MGMATPSSFMRYPVPNGIMLAFRLDGNAQLKALPKVALSPLVRTSERFTDAQRVEGERQFMAFCAICHLGPVNPDLQRSAIATNAKAWQMGVIEGTLTQNGMASFAEYLTPEQAESIWAYILNQAEQASAR